MGGLVGRRIFGYCNGFFGRDDYNDKIIILEGRTWIVCAYTDEDSVTCANFATGDEKNEYVEDWSKEYDD